ncbi:hypothetical protein DTO195F2_6238 [Paecilomyces variotii]|nr:hypothetical protein DTO195F2_6238 [Paecilomyces variotii]KAJ9374367.1 hypothetical protein DTO282E5_893 [Paecilomyces variotii]KAJ9401718.1 hypothetical protein DTO282F9_1488 [Paecilomyces variotii]
MQIIPDEPHSRRLVSNSCHGKVTPARDLQSGKSHVIDTSGTMLAVPYSAWGENYGRLDTGHHEVRDGLDRRSKEADATAIGGYRWTQSPQSSRSSSWKLYVRI